MPVESTEGPLASLEDPDFGMSSGAVFVFSRETQVIICRNNSAQPKRLPSVSTPIWLDSRWRHVEMDSIGQTRDAATWTLGQPVTPPVGYPLQPGKHVALTLKGSHLRPIRANRYLHLFPDREPLVVSDQDASIFHVLWSLIAVLVCLHLLILDQGHLAAGLSFGAIIVAVYAAVPRLLTAPLDLAIRSFMPEALWSSKDVFGLDDCVSHATVRAVLGGLLVFLGGTLVSTYLATVVVPTGWWRAGYSVLALAATNHLVTVHGFNPIKEVWNRISRAAASPGRSPGQIRS
jgi:hypothetical protein